MKKTYMEPDIELIAFKLNHVLLTASQETNLGHQDNDFDPDPSGDLGGDL